jgi:hypothetical protein
MSTTFSSLAKARMGAHVRGALHEEILPAAVQLRETIAGVVGGAAIGPVDEATLQLLDALNRGDDPVTTERKTEALRVAIQMVLKAQGHDAELVDEKFIGVTSFPPGLISFKPGVDSDGTVGLHFCSGPGGRFAALRSAIRRNYGMDDKGAQVNFLRSLETLARKSA